MHQQETLTDIGVLVITSRAFMPFGTIPAKYTCAGEDMSPPLTIDGIPPETRSLAVVIEDPDAPGGTWLHWLVWNIPVIDHISENEIPGDQGMNDFGRIGYGGPCPPSGTHRYIFKVYALDDLLDASEGSIKKDVDEAIKNHILAYGELTGVFKRRMHR